MAGSDLHKIQRLINEVEKVVIGKREVIQLTVTALLAGGHVLFEDIPGVGKTVLVKTLAKALQADFSRIQFTPDLQPSDISGIAIFNEQSRQFEFQRGPIFTTVLLADEINRTSPRTQSALLEAMSEGHVTIDGETHPLPADFFVLATENPLEYEGTFPLPEAQLDRFLFRLAIGYPEAEDELRLIKGEREAAFSSVEPVLTLGELHELKGALETIYVDELVAKYALELVLASRNHDAIALGVSPRGGIAFLKAAKAYAMTQGRQYVTPEDLQAVLPAVFNHRLIFKEGLATETMLAETMTQIIKRVAVPVRRQS